MADLKLRRSSTSSSNQHIPLTFESKSTQVGTAFIASALRPQQTMPPTFIAPLLSFASPFPRPPLQRPPPKRSRSRSPTLSLHPNLSRRVLLLTALSLPLLPPPHPTQAYSSPYNPSNTSSENSLPPRLYESTGSSVVSTPSGLQYFDLLPGNGALAKSGDIAYIYYTSRLRGLNGIKIQSTYDDSTSPPSIVRIGAPDVVPGVSEALTGMRVGGKRRAVLPPKIAYRSPDMLPKVTNFFARRRLLSVLETQRDATIVFE